MAELTNKVIFVVGPTASGKSAWALEQAIKHKGSILNCDSVQFYKGLEIGSAAPSEQEKKQVPHYLYSYVECPQEMTAGKFSEDFYQINEQKILKFPLFVVGGTGFYVQALEKGLFDLAPTPVEVSLQLEKELAEEGAEKLYAELLEKDPNTFIHLNDHYRIVRALEIIRSTGKIPSQMKNENALKKRDFPFKYIKVGFSHEKEEFLKRVRQRTKNMIQQGIIDEVLFFKNKAQPTWAPLASVGFRETSQFILENKSHEWLEESINQATMKLIKKQKTWFKRDGAILWSEQSEHLEQFLRENERLNL